MNDEKQKTILLVEDEAITAMAEVSTLETFGYKVILANSGKQAVEIVAKTPAIDLILMDINLGAGIDGTEAAALILRDRDLPVVFLSGHTEPEIVEKTEKITSYGYVVKGSGNMVLRASIKMAFKLFEAKTKEQEKESQMEAALAALEKSSRLLTDTGEMAKVGGWELDLSTREISWTEEVARIHGVEPGYKPKLEEALNFYAPESRPDVEAALKKAEETGEPYDLEALFIPQGGKDKIWVRALGKAVYSGGKIVKLAGTFQNIDKYKRAEDALRESEEKFHEMTDMLPQIVFELDLKGNFKYVNRFGFDYTGYTAEDIKNGLNAVQLFIPEDRQRVIMNLAKISGGAIMEPNEYTGLKKDGSTFHSLIYTKPIVRNEKIVGYRGLVIDISERKRMEEAVIESKNKLNNILTNIRDVVWSLSWPDFNVLYLSPSIEKLYGRTAREFIENTDLWQEVTHPDDKHVIDKALEQLQKEGTATRECRIILPDGSIKWIYDKSKLIFDQNHIPVRVEGLSSDITERKEAEFQREAALEALRKSEELYQAMIETSPDAIVLNDKNGIITLANQQLAKMHGYESKAELIGKNALELFAPEERQRAADNLGRAIESKPEESGKFEYILQRKDGTRFWGELHGKLILFPDGKLPVMLTIVRDISERKRAEEALLESEEKYRGLTENINLGIYRNTVGPEGKFIEANPAIIGMFGYINKEEFLAVNVSDLYQNPADRKKFNDKMLKAGVVKGEELWLKKKDGSFFIGSVSAVAIKDQQGQVKYYDGIIENIDERKRTESQREAALEALRESEEQYRTLIKNVGEGIGFVNPEEQFVFANPAAENIFGATPGGLPGRSLREFIRPEQFGRIHEQSERRHAGEKSVYEIEISRPEGEKRNLLITAVPQFDSQGKFAGTFGIFRDISERKEAEEEIKRQLAEKEILLREVHHRIKNNIAAIGALISLHLKTVTNSEAVAVLQDAIGRVNSMGILYDKLLLSEDFVDISVKNYVENLADMIVALFPGGAKIQLDKSITDFQLDPKRLFPLGLIINELITNKMKYAFINRKNGLIKISLKIVKNHITLTIQDNGNELPDGFDINEAKGFGLMLVKMLSQQLGGSFTMGKKAGTRCKVEFDI